MTMFTIIDLADGEVYEFEFNANNEFYPVDEAKQAAAAFSEEHFSDHDYQTERSFAVSTNPAGQEWQAVFVDVEPIPTFWSHDHEMTEAERRNFAQALKDIQEDTAMDEAIA